MRPSLAYIPFVAFLVSAVPVADIKKRQNAEYDYVIVGVSSYR